MWRRDVSLGRCSCTELRRAPLPVSRTPPNVRVRRAHASRCRVAEQQRRVVITGIGALTPIGITHDAMWNGLKSQRSAIRSVTRFDASIYRSQIAAEIDFPPSDFLEERRVKRLDRFG